MVSDALEKSLRPSDCGVSAAPVDVSVVIVSYNGKKILENCLRSLFDRAHSVSIEVIVSDNGSVDGTLGMVRRRFPRVSIMENGANLGFAAANNRALVYCTGRYVLLLNPDTIIRGDAIGILVGYMDVNSRYGSCGPKLLNRDGSLQHSARNFPTVVNQLAEAIMLHKLFPRSPYLSELIADPSFYESAKDNNDKKDKKSEKEKNGDNGAIKPVDWVTGAALMIRREALEDVGSLDERYFMYSEEKDWCFNAWRKGWPVAFVPETEITHLHGDSGVNPNQFEILVRSKSMFLRKNYPPVRASAIIAIMGLNLAIRFLMHRVALRVGEGVSENALRRLAVSRAGLRGLAVGSSVARNGPMELFKTYVVGAITRKRMWR